MSKLTKEEVINKMYKDAKTILELADEFGVGSSLWEVYYRLATELSLEADRIKAL